MVCEVRGTTPSFSKHTGLNISEQDNNSTNQINQQNKDLPSVFGFKDNGDKIVNKEDFSDENMYKFAEKKGLIGKSWDSIGIGDLAGMFLASKITNKSQETSENSNFAQTTSREIFSNLRANDAELQKLSSKEREQYETLFSYTNSKSHGMNKDLDKQITEWNKNHPNCKIRSQYDKVNVKPTNLAKLQSLNLRASDAELQKLSSKEREQYETLFSYTNSKSHGMNKDLDKQITEWNKNHPNCKIRSQYDKSET